ncbi:hypothetical protein Tco_1543377 [Tanacetum coccineum]
MSSSTVTYTSELPSPNYVPGPEHPPSPDYMPGPEYLEYVAPSDDEIPEDPEEDPADYLADGGNDEKEEEARKTFRLQPPMAASTKALIAEFASAPTPSSPPPSPLSHYATYADAPLGFKAAMIWSRAASPPPVPSPPLLLPSTDQRSDFPEVDMPSQKRLCLTAPDSRFEVRESSTAAAARKTWHTLARRVDYRFVDTVDASI